MKISTLKHMQIYKRKILIWRCDCNEVQHKNHNFRTNQSWFNLIGILKVVQAPKIVSTLNKNDNVQVIEVRASSKSKKQQIWTLQRVNIFTQLVNFVPVCNSEFCFWFFIIGLVKHNVFPRWSHASFYFGFIVYQNCSCKGHRLQ